jgi:hypothetical protein
MPIIGFIIPFIGIELIIGIPMFVFGIAFIMMESSYAAPRSGQVNGRYARAFHLFMRRSVSPAGSLIRFCGEMSRYSDVASVETDGSLVPTEMMGRIQVAGISGRL